MDKGKIVIVAVAAIVGYCLGMSTGFASGGGAANGAFIAASVFAIIAGLLVWKTPMHPLTKPDRETAAASQLDEPQELIGQAVTLANEMAQLALGMLRTLWNAEMMFLKGTGALLIFQKNPWLFGALAMLLLAFLFPLGVIFVASAVGAITRDPRAETDFVVPVR